MGVTIGVSGDGKSDDGRSDDMSDGRGRSGDRRKGGRTESAVDIEERALAANRDGYGLTYTPR